MIRRLRWIFLVVLLVAMSGVAVFPPPAQAATVSVQPPEGAAGTTFTFQAEGFLKGERVGTWLEDPSGKVETIEWRAYADSEGRMSLTWTAPNDVRGGFWRFIARGQVSRYEAAVEFAIIAPETPPSRVPSFMVMPEARGQPGSTLTFVARGGFDSFEQVGTWFLLPDGSTLDVALGISSDASGQIYREWVIPDNAQAGQWVFRARGINSGFQIDIPFEVVRPSPLPPAPPPPSISVEPSQGTFGTTFTFTADGFKPNERVGTWLIDPTGHQHDLDAENWIHANEQGAISWTWTVGDDTLEGTWRGVIQGIQSRARHEIPVEVVATAVQPTPIPTVELSVTPQEGPRGSSFDFTGRGFKPKETVFYWAIDPTGFPNANSEEAVADEHGVAHWNWDIESDLPTGKWMMYARGDATRREGSVPFIVTDADLPPDGGVVPASGSPGMLFTFAASGFYAYEALDLWIVDPADDVRLSGPRGYEANRDGYATWTWTAPEKMAGGIWHMVARGNESRYERVIPFQITRDAPPPPLYGVNPQSGPPGTTFHFYANELWVDDVSYWITDPDGDILPEDRTEYRRWTAEVNEGRATWSWTAPAEAQPGLWMMVVRIVSNERYDDTKQYEIYFWIE